MSGLINVKITSQDDGSLTRLSAAMMDRTALHKRIETDVLITVHTDVAAYADSQHKTANALGAKPTNHLIRDYARISSVSDAQSAQLLVPRASRLRAAFGSYVAKPREGKTYLTIPVNAESYGRRAREFDDLTFLKVGPRKTAILARTDEDGNMTTMYLLVKSVKVKEDDKLLPFKEISERAAEAAKAYFDELEEESLLS
jgi:hypothetical protein